jgi:hypothetical protein
MGERERENVTNETEPDCKDIMNQRPFREEFVMYKMLEEHQASSATNSQNSRKNDKPHKTISCGYISKIPEWEEQVE